MGLTVKEANRWLHDSRIYGIFVGPVETERAILECRCISEEDKPFLLIIEGLKHWIWLNAGFFPGIVFELKCLDVTQEGIDILKEDAEGDFNVIIDSLKLGDVFAYISMTVGARIVMALYADCSIDVKEGW